VAVVGIDVLDFERCRAPVGLLKVHVADGDYLYVWDLAPGPELLLRDIATTDESTTQR
jgi:hypothetical protein